MVRHFYLRDYSKSNKHPVGCLAVEVNREQQEIKYAFSVCSPVDIFNSNLAKEIANGRLRKSPVSIKGEIPASGHQITKRIMEDIVNRHNTQSSTTNRSYLACKSAVEWLTKAQTI